MCENAKVPQAYLCSLVPLTLDFLHELCVTMLLKLACITECLLSWSSARDNAKGRLSAGDSQGVLTMLHLDFGFFCAVVFRLSCNNAKVRLVLDTIYSYSACVKLSTDGRSSGFPTMTQIFNLGTSP